MVTPPELRQCIRTHREEAGEDGALAGERDVDQKGDAAAPDGGAGRGVEVVEPGVPLADPLRVRDPR